MNQPRVGLKAGPKRVKSGPSRLKARLEHLKSDFQSRELAPEAAADAPHRPVSRAPGRVGGSDGDGEDELPWFAVECDHRQLGDPGDLLS
jgi:hypothetical protein